jgi:hypothetical protein
VGRHTHLLLTGPPDGANLFFRTEVEEVERRVLQQDATAGRSKSRQYNGTSLFGTN